HIDPLAAARRQDNIRCLPGCTAERQLAGVRSSTGNANRTFVYTAIGPWNDDHFVIARVSDRCKHTLLDPGKGQIGSAVCAASPEVTIAEERCQQRSRFQRLNTEVAAAVRHNSVSTFTTCAQHLDGS